ncbi:hypothetical protein IF2G_09162 [Cordyceps javanica]|nr:hypothetical protein IF2G_09162 [Cordyceps javanica]
MSLAMRLYELPPMPDSELYASIECVESATTAQSSMEEFNHFTYDWIVAPEAITIGGQNEDVFHGLQPKSRTLSSERSLQRTTEVEMAKSSDLASQSPTTSSSNHDISHTVVQTAEGVSGSESDGWARVCTLSHASRPCRRF